MKIFKYKVEITIRTNLCTDTLKQILSRYLSKIFNLPGCHYFTSDMKIKEVKDV